MMLAFPIITLIESISVEGDVVSRKSEKAWAFLNGEVVSRLIWKVWVLLTDVCVSMVWDPSRRCRRV